MTQDAPQVEGHARLDGALTVCYGSNAGLSLTSCAGRRCRQGSSPAATLPLNKGAQWEDGLQVNVIDDAASAECAR